MMVDSSGHFFLSLTIIAINYFQVKSLSLSLPGCAAIVWSLSDWSEGVETGGPAHQHQPGAAWKKSLELSGG